MSAPLAGISVLDFTTLLPGPLATLMLAGAGADITKIERPGGEDMRRFPPMANGQSLAYAALNAGKRTIPLDLKSSGAMDVLRPLIGQADILVEQFRPGVMQRLGLGYESVRAINPRLIYCSISGYGQSGPREQEAGHDLNYQARTGLLSLSPGSPQQPTVPPALLADIAGGSFTSVINILLALRRRDTSGEGCHLDIAMSDAMATFAWHAVAEQAAAGRNGEGGAGFFTGGLPRYRLYATADHRFLAVGALEQKFWECFCEGIGLEPALRDDRRDPAATAAAIAALVGARPAAHWRETLEPLDCCCCIVASLAEAMQDPHFRERGLFQRAPDGTPRLHLPIVPGLRANER